MIIKISLKNGEELVERQISDFPVTIGRHESSGISLPHSGISAHHAELSLDGKKLIVRDLGSRNGTYVGDERIILKAVSLPCRIRLGLKVVLEVYSEDNTETPEQGRPAVFQPPARSGNMLAPATATVAVESRPKTRPKKRIGCDSLWYAFAKMGWKAYAGASAAAFLLFAFLYWLLASESLLYSLAGAIGLVAASALVAAAGAGICALPGKFLRGSYEIRPLLFCFTFVALLFTVHMEFLQPLSLTERWGDAARFFSSPILVLGLILISYFLLFSAFPHRRARAMAIAALVAGGATGIVASRELLRQDKQDVARVLFFKTSAPSRLIAGQSVRPADLSLEMKSWEKELLEDSQGAE